MIDCYILITPCPDCTRPALLHTGRDAVLLDTGDKTGDINTQQKHWWVYWNRLFLCVCCLNRKQIFHNVISCWCWTEITQKIQAVVAVLPICHFFSCCDESKCLLCSQSIILIIYWINSLITWLTKRLQIHRWLFFIFIFFFNTVNLPNYHNCCRLIRKTNPRWTHVWASIKVFYQTVFSVSLRRLQNKNQCGELLLPRVTKWECLNLETGGCDNHPH